MSKIPTLFLAATAGQEGKDQQHAIRETSGWMVETLIDDEGELRHGSNTDLLPPRKPRRELHRRTSGTAPEYQDEEPPKEREDDLIRGDAALHLPYKSPQLPPEQNCKEDEAEDAQDLAN
jgi:hypothetical protein